MIWMISANGKMYDHASAFQKWGFIDWRQNLKFNIGDTVYIYCTRPFMKVMYKTIVDKESLSSEEIVNDEEYWFVKEEYLKALGGKYARLRLVAQVDSEELTLEKLMTHGLNGAPQKGLKVPAELSNYINKHMNDYYSANIFPESDDTDNAYEGTVHEVLVNRYERSSIARQKCIQYHGCKCIVCGLEFEKIYGEIGKNFIHVHHLIPLNEIGKEYIVDYKNDLIPVCPNCHAMLHREINGERYSWQELRDKLKR